MVNDVVIIGSGIVGLATALKLKEADSSLSITVVEKESGFAKHQTGHNSGVIHSGIYYKPGSLRATNCKRGYDMLLQYLKSENIPHDVCGKIIVATNEDEIVRLNAIYERGIENGLQGLEILDAEGIKKREPHVRGLKAIFVPQSGIVDYTQVSKSYYEKFLQAGGIVDFNTKVIRLHTSTAQTEVITDKQSYFAKLVINCAGLYSDKVASTAVKKLSARIVPFRGEYYELKKEREYLVKNLVYPVPDPNFPFLGVHFTRFISGGIEAGPNAVLAYAREGYKKSNINVAELWETLTYPGFRKLASKFWRTGAGEFYRSYSKTAFTKALQKLIPEIREDDLVPGGAGVRASATSYEGNVVDDFMIEETAHGIHVLNSPSPAATASLSIGLTIAEMAIKKLNKQKAQ